MLDCNTYLIKGDESLIVDVGGSMRLPMLVSEMARDGINPQDIKNIVNTHLHPDHCGANDAFKKMSGASIGLHPLQQEFHTMVVVGAANDLGIPLEDFQEDFTLPDVWQAAGVELELIPATGHSPESISFYCRKNRFLLCGDVLFYGNTGRVDLPGGSGDELKEAIERLSKLDIEYLLPGHMNIVSGSANVKMNFDFIKENIFPWL